MRCPECVRTGQRSEYFPPSSWFSTAMGGSESYFDEDGEKHYHEVNSLSAESGGLEPLRVTAPPVFEAGCRPFRGTLQSARRTEESNPNHKDHNR